MTENFSDLVITDGALCRATADGYLGARVQTRYGQGVIVHVGAISATVRITGETGIRRVAHGEITLLPWQATG